MQSDFCGELGALGTAQASKPLADLAMQLRTTQVRHSLVHDLPVESVPKLVVGADLAVRERMQARAADQPLPVGEALAQPFDLRGHSASRISCWLTTRSRCSIR